MYYDIEYCFVEMGTGKVIAPGSVMYLKNGETVSIKRISKEHFFIEYKHKTYQREIISSYNVTLFPEPYDESKKYFNLLGYDEEGYTGAGYDKDGFNRDGFDSNGFDANGYDINGFDRAGFNSDGFDISGYDREGFNSEGFNLFGLDREGYDKSGFNLNGLNRDGRDRQGFIKKEIELPDNTILEDSFRFAKELTDKEYIIVNGLRLERAGIRLKCKLCGINFLFGYPEYIWYKNKNFDLPKRCKTCIKEKTKNFQDRNKYAGLMEAFANSHQIKRTAREMAYNSSPYSE